MATEFTSFAGNKRTIASDTARTASFKEIPIISLKSPKPELISQLRDACTRVGFFYIQDHDVPQAKIDKTFHIAKSFFAQEQAVKNAINYKKSKILRGYEPPAEVRTDETKKADLNEAFNWGYERDLDLDRGEGDEEIGSFASLAQYHQRTFLTTYLPTSRVERKRNVRRKRMAPIPRIPGRVVRLLRCRPSSSKKTNPYFRSSPRITTHLLRSPSLPTRCHGSINPLPTPIPR